MPEKIAATSIGIALRETLMRAAFRKELAKVIGDQSISITVGMRQSLNAKVSVTHLALGAQVFRVSIEPVD